MTTTTNVILEYDIEAPITSKVVDEMPNDSLLAEMLSLYRRTTPPPRCFRSPPELAARSRSVETSVASRSYQPPRQTIIFLIPRLSQSKNSRLAPKIFNEEATYNGMVEAGFFSGLDRAVALPAIQPTV